MCRFPDVGELKFLFCALGWLVLVAKLVAAFSPCPGPLLDLLLDCAMVLYAALLVSLLLISEGLPWDFPSVT